MSVGSTEMHVKHVIHCGCPQKQQSSTLWRSADDEGLTCVIGSVSKDCPLSMFMQGPDMFCVLFRGKLDGFSNEKNG
jgi:hypothetical protein